jgi:V/A-type H+-transporting ATPase subunit I
MQFLSVTGPKDEIDRVVETYLSKYEIQLENALAELSSVADLKPFLAINPYRETLSKAEELLSMVDTSDVRPDSRMTIEQAVATVDRLTMGLQSFQESDHALKEQQEKQTELLDQILPFESLDFDLHKLLSFQSVKYRFGRIAIDYIDKFEQYVYGNASTIFYQSSRDNDYVWGVYFGPQSEIYDIDAIYKSLHFERIYLPDEYTGTPAENIVKLKKELNTISMQLDESRKKKAALLERDKEAVVSACTRLRSYSKNFDVRRLAACTENKKTYFILCGWMTQKDANQFAAEMEADDSIHCILYDENANRLSTPPTKLKNPKLIKPFEMYIKMYGLPNYNEIDPTLFVALTYSFIFGWMFGDVGQGLLLLIGGFLLYRFKKIDLAAIISMAGIFSTFFGFMFGSVFGFEDVLEPIWMRPMDAMSSLPFVGRLNTVFVFSIGFGMVLILVAMIIHIINAVKQKDFAGLWFDTNGAAGLVFYGALATVLVLYMSGNTLPATAILVVLFVVPLILIGFKEPIANFLQKKQSEEETGVAMTIVQAIFELIEVLLSYFSNTISFVRIGAFAISHAAMMEVVLMLAGASEGGDPNWIVVVLGNLFVCGMEGLVVGIQVLRLEYYEMFSRFYKGDGREFKPYTKD